MIVSYRKFNVGYSAWWLALFEALNKSADVSFRVFLPHVKLLTTLRTV